MYKFKIRMYLPIKCYCLNSMFSGLTSEPLSSSDSLQILDEIFVHLFLKDYFSIILRSIIHLPEQM